MRVYDIIAKKRDGLRLSKVEIAFIVDGFVRGEIPDYQMSAWLMACYLQGLDGAETANLTSAMVESGKKIDLSAIPGRKVDKHSTGGVGDKTTLTVLPMVAACGVPVAKMSGRGLGHTGGTLDKLESIPGFNVNLTMEQFISQVEKIGVAIAGTSEEIVPADKKIYALRDVTATVSSIPLIASSVMSKKIAGGADAIVLDVKVGSGAFMKKVEEARELARIMVLIGQMAEREVVAVITNMDGPLGMAVGNALEVREAIETLKDNGPPDFKELCLEIGGQMLILGEKAADLEEAKHKLEEVLASGAALKKFAQLIKAQGGNPAIVDRLELLPRATIISEIPAERSGYIQSIDAAKVGEAALELGAGRLTKESSIDLSVGILLRVKVGDSVMKGEPIAELHAGDYSKLDAADSLLTRAIMIREEKPVLKPLVYDIIRSQKPDERSQTKGSSSN